jgi:hypothetical protein
MKIIFGFLLLLITIQVCAQNYPVTGITITLPANPDAKTLNWKSGVSMLSISANAKIIDGKVDPRVQESKMLVTINKGSTKICGIYTSSSAPASNFTAATKIWNGNNATSYLGQDCILPPGEYQLCVQFFSGYPLSPISIEKCKAFTIQQISYQAPQALIPFDGFSLTNAQAVAPINFKWTAVSPAFNGPVTYKLKVWQLMQGQSKTQAMAANQPIINQDVNNITQKLITNLINGPCQPPYLCEFVWNVQSLNAQGLTIGNNNGISNSNYFKIQDSIPVTPAPIVYNGNIAVGDTIRAGENGEFLIKTTDVTKLGDGSYTGKGIVDVGWLSSNIAVEFTKIRIDSTKRLKAGGIVTQKTTEVNYVQAWLMANLTAAAGEPLDAVMNWSNDKVEGIVNWVNNNNFQFPNFKYKDIATPTIPANSLKMPYGVYFDDPDDKLMITEMMFGPNASKVNFVAQKNITRGTADYKLGFAGKYFVMHPDKIKLSEGRLELVENISIPNIASTPKMKFYLKKGSSQQGCFIQWDSTGVKEYGLGIDIKFTRDWLLPVPTSNDSVTATLSGSAGKLNDILLTGNMPNCEIVGTNKMKIMADSVALDLSETRNASFMYFPSNYNSDTSAQGKLMWEGIYIKTQKLTLPDNWKTGANPTQITITNTLIDDYGLTMKAKALNIITFPNGRVSDMSASLDTLEVSILKSSLTDANAKGKLVLPISKDTITNTLKYTATFAQAGGGSFQVVIVPTGPIDADIMKGKITLSNTSNITSSVSDTSVAASILLNGTFKWDDPSFNIPPSNDTVLSGSGGTVSVRTKGVKGIKMEMDFQNLSLAYSYSWNSNNSNCNFNLGSWSFASPQKRMANFPISLKNYRYKTLDKSTTTSGGWSELIRAAVLMDVIANLTDDIGGSTTLGVAFSLEVNKSARKVRPKFRGIIIDSLHVDANMPAVKIKGYLKMYDNDAVYGDGFLATLKVLFPSVSVEANALVQFGNTVYQNNNQYYRYWRAEADVKFNPGIPFLTGVGFYGFGGGAFYNMEANLVQRAAPEVGFKYSFKPKKSSLGFMAMATVATLPKFETFNTDLKLLAQFSTSGGITKLGFTGDFWLAASLQERDSAKIKGGVAVEYNFPDKIFYMAALLSVNVPPAIKTPSPVGFVMNINGLTNKWYFKAGTPTATNNVRVFGIDLYSYMMFGNDIPVPNGFTDRFKNNYFTATGSYPTNNVGAGGVGSGTSTGKGIATGVGIEFSQSVNKKIFEGTCRNWYIGGTIMAGAELNLAFMHQTGCIGINGYRASGNIGLYGRIDAGITGSSFSKLCDDKYYSLFTIKTGAWVSAKFPNPEYLNGALSAQINLFDGLIDVAYSESFQKGTDCNGTTVVTADAPQEDEAADYRNKMIQSIAPSSHYSIPVTTTINVKYALIPNNIFDVSENQGDGTTKNRTFKMVVTTTLEIKNANGNWANLNLNSKLSNMGEYQYYYKPPISSTAPVTVSTAPAITAVFTTNNTSNVMSANGNLLLANMNGNVSPPPPPNYPNPIPPPVNSLEENKNYRFKVIATLKELVNGNWTTATTRTGLMVSETKTYNFRTGPIEMAPGTSIQSALHN